MNAYPGFSVVLKQDSNILRLPDADPGRRSSSITVLSPSLLLQAQRDAHDYSLAYNADIGRYGNSSEDDYVDHNFLGEAVLELSTRAKLTIRPKYLIGHDDRGSTYGALTTEPNTWHSTDLDASYAYGAQDARGKAVLELGYTDLQYQNNRSVTVDYDKKLNEVAGTFYFRVQPKTYLLVHAKHTGIEYQQPGSLLNSKENRYMLGVKWEASAQTTGEVRVGQLHKKFDSSLKSYTGGSWEGAVHWSPMAHIKVDMLTSKQTNESTLLGSSAIVSGNFGANVSYVVNDRVTLRANGYRLKEDFTGVSRADHTDTFGLSADYEFRSWLLGGVEYTNSARDSNSPLDEYRRNIFMLSLKTVL